MMKKTIIIMLLMLTAISSFAQESKSSDEKSLAPIVIEGNVERVPDGTVIWLGARKGGSMGSGGLAKDSVINGKFRIKCTPKKAEDDYSLYSVGFGHSLDFFATSGTTTTVTGVGVDYENWYAKNDNPLQKEANEYRAYLDAKVPGYYDIRRRSDWIDRDDDEYYIVRKKRKQADSLFVEHMTEYMQDKKFSPVFAHYLFNISRRILLSKNKVQRKKAAKLLEIAPKVENRFDDEYVYEARRDLMPKFERIKIGEKLHDFVLYDHQDKEHHLTEFNGNGKYLLLEFNSRTCEPCVKHRPIEVLNNLYKNHSDKVDMLMVNCDAPYFWDIECKDPNKYGRDPWHEWNDKKGAEDIMQRYGSQTGPHYLFISPDGTILGRISDKGDLKAAITKYFNI